MIYRRLWKSAGKCLAKCKTVNTPMVSGQTYTFTFCAFDSRLKIQSSFGCLQMVPVPSTKPKPMVAQVQLYKMVWYMLLIYPLLSAISRLVKTPIQGQRLVILSQDKCQCMFMVFSPKCLPLKAGSVCGFGNGIKKWKQYLTIKKCFKMKLGISKGFL